MAHRSRHYIKTRKFLLKPTNVHHIETVPFIPHKVIKPGKTKASNPKSKAQVLGTRNSLMKKIDDISTAIKKARRSIDTMVTVPVNRIIDDIRVTKEKLLVALDEARLASGVRRKVENQIYEISRDFDKAVNSATERLQGMRIKLIIGRITEDGTTIKEIPVTVLLSVIESMVEEAKKGKKLRVALYMEYFIAGLKWFDIPEIPSGLHGLMRQASWGTSVGNKNWSLKHLSDSLIMTESKNGNLNFCSLQKRLELVSMSPNTFYRVAASRFRDEMAELLRLELNIKTLVEEAGIAGATKLKPKKWLKISGSNKQGTSTFVMNRIARKEVNELVWYKINLFLKGQMTDEAAGLKGLEIVGGKAGDIKIRHVEFLNQTEMSLLKNGRKHVLALLEDRMLKLQGDVNDLLDSGSRKRLVITSQELKSSANSRKISKWSPERYNAFRRAFEDIIPGDKGSFWTRGQNTGRGVFEKGRFAKDSHTAYSSLLRALGFKHAWRSHGGYQWRFDRANGWLKSLANNGGEEVAVKGVMKDFKERISKIQKDPTHLTIDGPNLKRIDDVMNDNVRKAKKSVLIAKDAVMDFCDVLRYWFYQFAKQPLRKEAFYQFLLESVWQRGLRDIKPQGKVSTKLKKVLMDVHGQGKEWRLLDELSITNLKTVHGHHALDHLNVYYNKKTGEFIIVGIQDKVLLNGKWTSTSTKSGEQLAEKLAVDFHNLQNVMMGLFNETKTFDIIDGVKSLSRWGGPSGLFLALDEVDRGKLKRIIALQRDPNIIVNNIAVFRVAAITEGTSKRIITTFQVWEPPNAKAWEAAQKFKVQGGSLEEFARDLEKTLALMDECIEAGELGAAYLSFVSKAFWGINKESLSADEAMEMYSSLKNILDDSFYKSIGITKIDLSVISKNLLESIGYRKLGQLYDQIEFLKQKALKI